MYANYLFFFFTIGVPVFFSHQLKDPRPLSQRFKEDNYWDYYLKRRLVALRENEDVEPLLTPSEDLAENMCQQFNFKDECKQHFTKYYELYMLEYYRDYVEKQGNDLQELRSDLRSGRVSVKSIMQQQRDREERAAQMRQSAQGTSYTDEGDTVQKGMVVEQRNLGGHPSDVDMGHTKKELH